jgi:hypothetical protein
MARFHLILALLGVALFIAALLTGSLILAVVGTAFVLIGITRA